MRNQNQNTQQGDGKGTKKKDGDGNVIAAVDWDEQDGVDKLYHWILAVDLKEDKKWDPLDVRQIYQEMEEAGYPFVDQRCSEELVSTDERGVPPGLCSSSDEEPEAEQIKAPDLVSSSEDDESDLEDLEKLCQVEDGCGGPVHVGCENAMQMASQIRI